MKYLIAAACAVVIAAGGNYLWAQYDAHAEAISATRFARCEKKVDDLRQYRLGLQPDFAENLSVTRAVVRDCTPEYPSLALRAAPYMDAR